MKKTAASILTAIILLSLPLFAVCASAEGAAPDASGALPTVWQNGGFALLFRDLSPTGQMLTYVGAHIIIIVAAYLLGSLNSAIIFSKKLYGKDIRGYGSHNAGMTNMFRTFGKKAGFLTLAGDVLKALVSVLVGRLLLGEYGAYLAGTFCILGHIAPVYYRFRGGKGVIVTAVTVALVDPVAFAVLLAVFAVVFLIWRYVSLASVLAAFVYPAVVYSAAYLRTHGEGQPYPTAMLFSLFVGLLIIFLHRENLKRIYNGTESRVSFKRKKASADDDAAAQDAEKPAVRRTGGGKRSKSGKIKKH